MEYGIVLPHFAAFARKEAGQRILEAAEAAETLGYSAVWVVDHLVFPARLEGSYAFNPEDPILEPLTVLAALALKTSRVRLGTAVLVLPYRHPVYAAKALATIDVLSGGRVMVGVGAGWLEAEFSALGVPFSERGSRTDETIDLFKALWTQDPVNFSGRHFRVENMKFVPQPVQKPRPPILVGGTTRGALRRVARRGDGWVAMGKGPEDLKAPLDTLREFALREGRKPEEFRLLMLPLLCPSFEQLLKDVPRYAELGVHHLYLSLRAWTGEFSQFMELMRRFAREVGIGK